MKINETDCRNAASLGSCPITEPYLGIIGGRAIRLLLLAITVCVVWLTIENRWGSNFQFPVRYNGDSHYILGLIKLAKEGELGLFTHIYTASLGAPFTAQLNDFPQTERVIVWLAGQMARVIGLMPAANAILMLSCVVAAYSFYLAARLWRVSRLMSWIFAIVYAFLPQSHRSLDHLGIAFTGLLPLQLYCCWYLATVQQLSWGSFRFRLTFVISLLSGFLNTYWVFFFIHFYILAFLCRVLRRRGGFVMSLIPLAITCLVAGIFMGSFVVYRVSHGTNAAAIVRSYFDVEEYALKPIDLLLPNWAPYLAISSGISSRYYDGGRLALGELWWGAYIGLCSLLGLVVLFFKGIRRQINRKAFSLPCLSALWLISYISVGGPHDIICLILDSYHIRSINRYSAGIATIGLLYFVFIFNRLIQKWSLRGRVVFLTLLALLAVVDQSFKIYTFPFKDNTSIKEHSIADRDFVSNLEDKLEAGAMLYILPATDFPEPFTGRGAYKPGFSFYGSMRPFLYSSKLRYSYGSHKGRQGADWQLDVQELPAEKIPRVLESYGFSGIVLNRRAYEDRGEQLLSVFAQEGWPVEFEQGLDNEWVFIRLTPVPEPSLPTQTPYAFSVNE